MPTVEGSPTQSTDVDVVVVGASLAGCTAAALLGRRGVRVALVEQRADANAYKRVCGHYIQPPAIPTLERLGALEPALAAGAVWSRCRVGTPWGWIDPVDPDTVAPGLNLRRERLDPLLRGIAADTPGVTLHLGQQVHAIEHDAETGRASGVLARTPDGATTQYRARLVVAADGRRSRMAEMLGARTRRRPHGRFAYSAYFAGAAPEGSPDATVWFGERGDWGAAFPTDSGLTLYCTMDTLDDRERFRRGGIDSLVAYFAPLPGAPPFSADDAVSPLQGRIDMTCTRRPPVVDGAALIGDAALAADPLWGVGCGWALQSGAWLADAVAPGLLGTEPLDSGLARYRRRHRRELLGHALAAETFANGRALWPPERFLFAAGVHDEAVAARLHAYAAREIGPMQVPLGTTVPRAARAHARTWMQRRRARRPSARR